jgi:hypothetical protein
MVSEVDRVVAQADAAIDAMRFRNHHIGMKSRALKRAHGWRKLGRLAIAAGAIVVGAALFGAIVQPLGFVGTLVTLLAICGAVMAFSIWPKFPEMRAEELPKVDLKQLAGRTEIWLEAQRPALPAPAKTLVDGIGVQLDLLAPQLQALDPASPAAANIRKLVGEDLPELVGGYRRIPEPLRREAHAGRTPDDQLVDGLKLIEREIGGAARSLAAGKLDELATRGRYLELKYQGAGDEPAA